jgi:hypothetical protein
MYFEVSYSKTLEVLEQILGNNYFFSPLFSFSDFLFRMRKHDNHEVSAAY